MRWRWQFDLGALLFALAIAALGATWGFEPARSERGLKAGYPAGFYFVFGSVATPGTQEPLIVITVE